MLPILPLVAVVGNAAVVGAAHGVLSGAAFGAIIQLVVGAHNRRRLEDVVSDALHGAAHGALSGAVVGGALGAIGAAVHIARGAHLAHNFQHLEKAANGKKYLYTQVDPATNLTKIGVTGNPVKRIADVGRDVGSNLNYTSITPMDNAVKAEAALHQHFSSLNVPHPNHPTGREWFSGVDSLDVAGELVKNTVGEHGLSGGLVGSGASKRSGRSRRRRNRSARAAASGKGRQRRHRRHRRRGASRKRRDPSRRCDSRSARPARA